MEQKLSSRCLFCNGDLAITCLHCNSCGTKIESELPIPRYFRLGQDLQDFVLVFLRCRGNIREVEKALGISYPTVCKRLDLVNELLGNVRVEQVEAKAAANDPAVATAKREQILQELEDGKIGASEAAQLLRAANDPAPSP